MAAAGAKTKRAPRWTPTSGHRFVSRLLARVARRLGFLHLIDNLTQVVRLRSLQWRVLYVRLEVLQPQLLANRQHVPVVLKCGHRGGERTAQTHRGLLV